jgi:hypothetical protein
MKKVILLFFACLILPLIGITQTLDNLDYVAPVNDGVIAIKKGNQWGFIDETGNIVVNFRDDIVSTEGNNISYPIFNNNRCIISQVKDGITYFGYIDKTGKTVIEPQYLNALNFNNEIAIVLELIKKSVGKNDVLDKKIISYRYFEVTIDKDGMIQNYLTPEGTHIILEKKYLKVPPKIHSKLITNNLYTTKTKNNKWVIMPINKPIYN